MVLSTIFRFHSLVAAMIILSCSFTNNKVKGQQVPQITQYIEEVVAKVGSSAFLNCTVSTPPGTNEANVLVEWMFLDAADGGKSISQDCKITEEHNKIDGQEKYEMICTNIRNSVIRYSLKINNLAVPDNGNYECRIRLSNEPKPTDRASVPLHVLSPPKIVRSASDVVVDAFIGQNVTLKCGGQGTPAPNVTWGRANGKPLPYDRVRFKRVNVSNFETRQDLYLYNVSKEDRGTYRCVADNNVRPPDDLFSRLGVEFKPTVSTVEPTYGSETGENTQIMIWCRVEGNPRPAMAWYKMSSEDSRKFANGKLALDGAFFSNAEAILTDNKYSVEQKIMTVGSLSTMESMFYSLTVLTVEPGDMVYYVCRAENTHGTDSVAVELYRVNTFAAQNNMGRRSLLSVSTCLFTLLFSVLVTSIY